MVGPKGFEFQAYLVMLSDPDFADHSAAQFADELGVKTSLIYEWNKRVDWEAVKADLRKGYAKVMPKVDRALFKATQKGDVPAIRTFYERFDNWTPASKVQTEQIVSDAELDAAIDGLLKLAGSAEAKAANGGAPAPAEDGANAVLPAESSATEVHQ